MGTEREEQRSGDRGEEHAGPVGAIAAELDRVAVLEAEVRELHAELARVAQARERELAEARAQAERAGAAKTAFLANMSHEIRTPLAAVMGYANLIAATEQGSGETRDWSRRLQRSAEHLLALLDDVLDLAKIEVGRLDLHLVPCEPTTLLEEVGVLMEPRAVERGLDLLVTCETELPARIRTDPLRARQILVNLVGNAIKYTERGQVALRARLDEAGGAGRRELVMDVIDTGVGIAEGDLARLFLPFEQGRQARSGRGGVGLGLDIARRLAQMLGGDIAVRSEVGAGSTFTLTLPVDPELGQATTPPRLVTRSGVMRPEEADTTRLDGRVILLVDDTEDNRRIVAHFLGQAGARVIEAATLAAAIGVMRGPSAGEIALVLTDLRLPDGEGLELVRAMRERGDRRPIVALTADALLETRMDAIIAGVDDFFVKPIVGHRLVARVAALMQRAGKAVEPQATPRTGSGAPASVRRVPRPATRPTPGVMTTGAGERPIAAAAVPPRVEAGGGAKSSSKTAPQTRPGQGPPPDVPIELLQKFYGVLAERVYAIEDALRLEDRVRLKDVAHRLAGSGSALGHPELTELGRLVEASLARQDAWSAVEPLATKLLGAAREAAIRRPWVA